MCAAGALFSAVAELLVSFTLDKTVHRVRQKVSVLIFAIILSTASQLSQFWRKIHIRCKFPIVYICQKLWQLAGSSHSYCENKQAYCFGLPRTLWEIQFKALSVVNRQTTLVTLSDKNSCVASDFFTPPWDVYPRPWWVPPLQTPLRGCHPAIPRKAI